MRPSASLCQASVLMVASHPPNKDNIPRTLQMNNSEQQMDSHHYFYSSRITSSNLDSWLNKDAFNHQLHCNLPSWLSLNATVVQKNCHHHLILLPLSGKLQMCTLYDDVVGRGWVCSCVTRHKRTILPALCFNLLLTLKHITAGEMKLLVVSCSWISTQTKTLYWSKLEI